MTEQENQLTWFRELLEVLENGDIEDGILAVKAAIGLLERQSKVLRLVKIGEER